MKRRMGWGYGGALAALAVAVASCADEQQHPLSPSGGSGATPVFTATAAFNNAGACMIDDAVAFPAFTNGWNANSDPTATNNCTTNDVRLANATATEYDLGDGSGFHVYDSNNPPVCSNSNITLKLTADLVQTSSSERNDFGIWIRTDAGDATHPLSAGARSGSCNHYNLPVNPLLGTTENIDGDSCADVDNAASAPNLDLGTVTVPCVPNEAGKLIINSCIGWKVPGDEGDPTKSNKGQCPAYSTGNGPNGPLGGPLVVDGAGGFRAGTLPGNTSKCNCEGFELNILVPTNLTIEKQTVGGTASFDYTVTGSGLSSFSRNTATQGNPTSTSAFAFTPAQFGEKYVTETALAGWTLTNITCQADGAIIAIGTGQGAGFNQGTTSGFDAGDNTVKVTITSADTPTCTFVNTKDASVAIQKQTVGGTASFDYTVSGSGLSSFSRNTDPTNPTTAAAATITPAQFGDKYITETALAGYTLTAINCTANGAVIAIGTGQGGAFAERTSSGFDAGDNTVKISVDAGDTPTCTFVNTAGSSLSIQKISLGGIDTFDYTTVGGGLSSFSRTTTTAGVATTASAFALGGADALGDKYITESGKSGWTLTDISCTANGATILIGTGTGGAFAQGTSAGYDAGDNTVKVTMAAGNSPTCTFTNTKAATFSVQKISLGGVGGFDFVGTGSGVDAAFTRTTTVVNTVTTAAAFAISGAQLGDKYAQETVPTGYRLTSVACTANGATVVIGRGGSAAFVDGGGNGFDAGDNTVKVNIGAGNTPECVFTNTLDASSIAIQKNSVGGTETFDYVASGGGMPPSFTRNTASQGNPTTVAAISLTGSDASGDKYVTESAESGWTLTGISCTAGGATVLIGTGTGGAFGQGSSAGYDAGDNTVKITMANGNNPSCTFTNTKDASLAIQKATVGATGSFDFSGTGSDVTASFSRNTTSANPTNAAAFVITGNHLGDKYVQETIPAGYALTNIVCTGNGATVVIGQGGSGAFSQGTTAGFDAGDNTVKVTVAAGSTPTCTFTNTELATLIITKTITGDLSPVALFDFSRTLGATYSTTSSFSPLSNGGSNNSGKVLFPGSYIVCELNVAVALTVSATVDASPATLSDLSSAGGNTDLCTTVTLTAGQTRTVAFTNSLVVGTGGTRTIGYWKNWASCARGLDGTGKQYLKAIGDGGVGIEFTLDGNIGVGEPDIYPIGEITVLTCEEAVELLSKNAIDGTKRAGDPIYNMVAQLLGAKLNIHAGSGTCSELSDAGGYFDRAQTLLDALNFTGLNPAWPKKGGGALSAADLAEAQFLAGKFGAYNEGTLGGGCPTHV